MKPEIILALDVPNRQEMETALARLPEAIRWFKVGLELFCGSGPDVLFPLQTGAKRIFLDLKLHDIPRTVEKAITCILPHRVHLLTLHAQGGREMMRAATQVAKGSETKLLAVTVLTSLDAQNLKELGMIRSPADQVLALAELAFECGVDGVVCSVHEAARIRASLGPDALIVTPGIRLPGGDAGDQKRVATPSEAQRNGASHIVVGHPVLGAADPAHAFHAMMNDFV